MPTRIELADLLAGAAACRDTLPIKTMTPGSPSEVDFTTANPDFAPAIARLVRSVDLWTMIATDHLAGVALTFRSGTSLFSIFPIFRSVLEHSAYVVWVLDDQVDARTRAARAALVELDGQAHLLGAATLLAGKPSETRTSHRAYGKQLRKDVAKEFGQPVTDPYEIDGAGLPGFTDIVTHFGSRQGDPRVWEGIYSYFCGTANHPSFNVYEYLDLTDPTSGPPMMSIDELIPLLKPVMYAYLAALELGSYYMGLPPAPVKEYIDQVNAVLGA